MNLFKYIKKIIKEKFTFVAPDNWGRCYYDIPKKELEIFTGKCYLISNTTSALWFYYYHNGYKHNGNGPAEILFWPPYKEIEAESFYWLGKKATNKYEYLDLEWRKEVTNILLEKTNKNIQILKNHPSEKYNLNKEVEFLKYLKELLKNNCN